MPFGEPKEPKDLQCGSNEFKAASGLNQRDPSFKDGAI
jgi:hypothetical protein